jgi:hypothetical protein
MSVKEAECLGVMRQVDRKTLSLRRASEELGLSLRQTKRIRKRYLACGEFGVISKRRGMRSPNKMPDALRETTVALLRTHFPDFGPTLAREKLEELYEVIVSKETVRKLMIEEHLWDFKKRRKIKIHQRRTRRPRFGEMLQGDGSPHDWFEGRSNKCCLILFVDDATSQITDGQFFPTETTEAYLECLEHHLKRFGKPISIYVDKHSIFRVNREEAKKGTMITHFGKVLKDLDIELICAHSPQAKGRVERKNGVLQDRLVKEMRIAGINTIEEANAFLPAYIKAHNQKFGKDPVCKEDAHRPLRESAKLERIFSRHETRKLSKDLTFQHKTLLYQLKTETPNRLRYANVDVFSRPGQPIEVEYEGRPLKYTLWRETAYEQPKILDSKELEALWKPREIRKPSLNHPWR